LENLPGIKVIADDILVYGRGKTLEESIIDHDNNVERLFERLTEKGVKLNKDKIQYK